MTRRISRTRPSFVSAAFTIVELLVVIAIIGVLAGLLIPAVQMARESGRRAMCTNNMHQLALAMHQHEELYGTLPPGLPNCVEPANFGITGGIASGAWCQGPTWTIALLPFLEEQQTFANIKSCMESTCNTCEECTMAVVNPANANSLMQLVVPQPFLCPSAEPIDATFAFSNETNGPAANMIAVITGPPAMPGGPPPTISIRAAIYKGNYAANFGSNTYLSYKDPLTAGMFDIVDVRGQRGAPVTQAKNDSSMKGTWKMGSKLGVRMASVTDGQSMTIMLSEVLGYLGAQDNRGAWTFGGMGGTAFSARLTPNSGPNDVIPSCQADPSNPFNCNSPGSQPSDPIPVTASNGTYAAARSSHAGNGVVVVMADASTHFMSADISAMVWQNLSTRRAGVPAELPPD